MRYLKIALFVCAIAVGAISMGVNSQPAMASEAGGEGSGFFEGTDGKSLYQQNCQGCHMPAGQGAKGAGMYPALANNPLLASPGGPTHVVLFGLRGMPSFDSNYTDEQVAAVVNYVITNFGNKSKERITPQEVRAKRPNPPISYD